MITKDELELNTLIKTINKELSNIEKSIFKIENCRRQDSIKKHHEYEYIYIEKYYKDIYKLTRELKLIEISLKNSNQYKKLAKKEITIDDLFNLDLFK